MQEHKVSKTKSGRPSELSLEAQILIALTYCREYRTLYHIGMDFGIHESSASRIVRKVDLTYHENCHTVSLRISIGQRSSLMPPKRPLNGQKKPKTVLQWKKETTYLKSASHRTLANRTDIGCANLQRFST